MHAHQNMDMVWIAENGISFTVMRFYYTAYDFFQFIPKAFFNQVITAADRENKLDVQLGICICHCSTPGFVFFGLILCRAFILSLSTDKSFVMRRKEPLWVY